MTIIQAIIQVMNEADLPLSPREAYEKIVFLDLYQFKAQYPLGIVNNQIRRHCIDLDFPSADPRKFFGMSKKNGKFYALEAQVYDTNCRPRHSKTKSRESKKKKAKVRNANLQSNLKAIQELQREHTELLKSRIITDLKNLSPESFEHFSKSLLDAYGFENLKVTSLSKDGGIDGTGKLKIGIAYMNVAFQCKRWQGSVGRPEIDKFRGAIQARFEQGIFFTTSKFTKEAKEDSLRKGAVPIVLIDGNRLAEMMIELQFGVIEETVKVYAYGLDTVINDYY